MARQQWLAQWASCGVPISLVLVVAKRKRFQVVDDQISQQEGSLVALLKMTYLHWFSLKKKGIVSKAQRLSTSLLVAEYKCRIKKSLGWCHHQVTRHPMPATETSLLPTNYHLKNETCSKPLVRRLLCSWHLPPFSSLHRSEHWPRKQSRGIQHFSECAHLAFVAIHWLYSDTGDTQEC